MSYKERIKEEFPDLNHAKLIDPLTEKQALRFLGGLRATQRAMEKRLEREAAKAA